jgi:hypothetical protein
MLEDQILNMINEIVSEAIEQEKEEIIIDNFSPPLNQQKFLNDSFDMQSSDYDTKRNPHYDYSPEYKFYIDENEPQRSKPRFEESKYQEDIDEDIEDDNYSFNIDKYNLDASKLTTKMEDIGFSPFKQKRNREFDQEIDVICIHCEEFINFKNVEIHSQY